MEDDLETWLDNLSWITLADIVLKGSLAMMSACLAWRWGRGCSPPL